MPDIIRYEPFFAKYLFSYQGDLYLVDGPIESEPDTLIVIRNGNPVNGLSVPAKIQIQVTNSCNLRCRHCYATSGIKRPCELSDPEICSFLSSCQKEGVLQIEWSGGEPFTRKGFVALMKFAQSLGFEQNLLTNGVALGKNAQLAREVWPYLHSVQVSMCGYEEDFDAWVGVRSWKTVLKGIVNLIASKPEYARVSIATTLDESNLGGLKQIGTLLSELGVDAWILARQIHNGRSSINEDEANEQLNASFCTLQDMRAQGLPLPPKVLHPFDKSEQGVNESVMPVEWITEPAARTFLYVAANGAVYPFPYYDGCAEWMSGNIRTASLTELWHCEQFSKMRAVTRADTGCGGCKKICQLWPRWFNYRRGGDIYKPPIKHPTCTNRPLAEDRES